MKSKRAEKEAAIIPRANYYMEICCPPGVTRDDCEKALKETHGRMAYNEHPRPVPAEMPHQYANPIQLEIDCLLFAFPI